MSTAPKKTKIGQGETVTGSELPEGWSEARIPDLIDAKGVFLDGDWVESKDQDPSGDVRLIQLADVGDGVFRNRSNRFLTSKKANELGCTFLEAGDILIARMPDPLGRACIFPGDKKRSVTAVDVCIVRPDRLIENSWLMHSINSPGFRSDIEAEQKGTTRGRISRSSLAALKMPVPPTSERRRIAEKIDSTFAEIHKTQLRLRRVTSLLLYFQQAVLAAACSGKLTEDWRSKNGTSETSDALLNRILEGRKRLLAGKSKEPKTPSEPTEDYPETWTPATLDQLTWLITSGSRGWARYYSDSGATFIRAENINSDWLNTSDIAHVRIPAAAEGSRTKVRLNDLLITITGANVTKSAVVDQELENAYVSQHVALVRPVEANTSRFLYLWIVSPSHGRKKLLDDAYGAGKPGLNLDNIREIVVALPPLEEQQEIVRRVQSLFKLADAIDKRVAAATLRAERLTQAILAKAFRGELVPTEAELARREGREYEPASVLLERIKAEREKAGSEKLRGKARAMRAKQ
jgi:type I restriction enzyme S subunit